MVEQMLKLDNLLDLAVATARRAGELLLERSAGARLEVESKTSPTDLVSEADVAAERAIVSMLQAARPDDGIVAEEGKGRDSNSGVTWIIDPLDGTINFLFRIPAWSVSVAARDERGPLVGVVHDPIRSETFAALRGRGATLNGQKIRVSGRGDLPTALIATGFAYSAEARRVQAERIPRILPEVRDLRRMGSAALDLTYVACGRLDGFFEAPVNEWDKAAGELLVVEAGGRMSPLPGPLDESDGLIASGPGIHDDLCRLVLG